ncbi:ubiquitin-protein ligase molybdopterin-converting factor [Lactarius hengduanensis]|nr:ubiquitin-protein ligase molybdopterin-converting factor [Lactarius hengduanensis]
MTIPVNLNSHKTQLLLTAAATAFTTYSLLSIYQSRSRQKRRNDLAEDIKRSLSEQTSSNRVQPSPSSLLPAPGTEYAEHLVREQLARNYAFLGEEGVARVRGSSVVVVGCGGVGSWAAVMLARSGVARIRLIDFDYVTLSSLNRHATAGLADVGTPKVQCVARALQGIAPFVRVDPRVELWRGGTDGADLLEGADWVVDAIDNIGTKVELLAYCVRNNIKVFSSMGAGTKSDPTRIQIADLSATHYDPLARAVRQRLRAVLSRSSPPTPPSGPDHDTDSDPDALSPSSTASEYSIPVVYSTEVPGDVALLPLADAELAKGSVDELAPLRDFRVRILPVLGPLPALFGLHIATYVLCELAGRPLERPLPVRHRKKLYERMWKDLLHRESRIARKQINTLPLTQTDIALLYDDFALGRSIVPPQAACVRPALVRWDPRVPLSLENCVVAEFKEAERAVRSVFATPQDGENRDDGIPTNALPSTNDYVDALGEPIDSALLLQGFVPTSPEELWGIEAAKIAQNRIAQARRFREWALQ